MSLQTRFIVSVAALILFLVVVILAVIEHRERRAIFEEKKSKGILIAKYIAQMNSYPLQQWDKYGIQESVDEQIDENLIYVVFYDRNKNPWVANDFIKAYEHTYMESNLDDEAGREDFYFSRKKLEDKESGEMLRILEIEIPIFAEGSTRRSWSIKIGYSLKEMRQENQRTRLMLILFGLGGLIIGVAGAILLSKRITGPLTKLVEGTVKISEGDFSQQITIDSRDEIGNLAQSFNDMSRQLQLTRERMEAANKKLIQAEKLASIGRISASIAHEIRNPLTSVKLNIQKIQENKQLDEGEREHLSITQEGIGQIEKFITQLLNYARVTELNKDEFSIAQVMDESVKMMADSLGLKNISLKKDYTENLPPVWIDGDKLRQVFLNILRNSCEAVKPGGKVKITVSQLKEMEDNKIRIVFADNGDGIPEKDWENIFEPFYTTKSSGIGLGLANARKIIEHHKGSIKVIKKDGKGSAFEILLPCEGEQ
ncbi:MAG: ATP-binding protein [Candidatus Aminicenantes bacterium]